MLDFSALLEENDTESTMLHFGLGGHNSKVGIIAVRRQVWMYRRRVGVDFGCFCPKNIRHRSRTHVKNRTHKELKVDRNSTKSGSEAHTGFG